MSERKPVQIPITTTADTRGVREVQGAFAGFLNSLKLGFGIDLARLMMQLPTRIARAFQGAVRTGIDFNATMEQSKIAIAAMLQTSQPERFRTFHDALSEGARLTALLNTKTKGLATTYLDLVGLFQVMTPYMAGAGIVDLRKQVDLIAAFDQIGRIQGMDRTKMEMELRSIFTGNLMGSRQQLPKFIGFTGPELKEWMRTGQLYDRLKERLDKTNEAAGETGKTLRGMWDIFTDVYAQSAGAATAKTFDNLKESLESLNELLANEDIRRNLRYTGDAAGELVKSLSDVAMQSGGWFGPRWMQQFNAATTLFSTVAGAASGMASGGRAGALGGALTGLFRAGRRQATPDTDDSPLLDDVPQPDPFDIEGARARFNQTLTVIKFQYDQKLMALDEYLRQRKVLLEWASNQEEAIFDEHAFDKMRLDLDLEAFQLQFGNQIRNALEGATVMEPTGQARKGIFTATGEAAMLDRQTSLQTRMVDLLEGIRNELRAKLPAMEAFT